MGISYKAFYCKRIVFCAVFLLFLTSFSFHYSKSAQAYDNLFTVEGVQVDVTAENSVAARDMAFVQAQIQAFEILASRMVARGQRAYVQTPDPSVISTLIQDYEITDEQLSAVRYLGTYTFRFKEVAVSRYFSGTGVSFTNTSSQPLLVLPFFQEAGRNVLWSSGNIWMEAWSRATLPAGLVPVEVPIGDLMDVADIGEARGLNYDAGRLSAMLGRYGAKEAALMLAVPDVSLMRASDDSAPARGDLVVSIYRTDRAGPELVQDFVVSAQGGETRAQIYDRAVMQAYGVLQDDWKNKTSASAVQQSRVQARVPFSNIKEWVRIQQILNNISGIGGVSVISVKTREARVEFQFRGDESRLRQVLEQANITLSQPYALNGNVNSSVYYDLLWGGNGDRSNRFYLNQHEPSSGDENEDFGVRTF